MKFVRTLIVAALLSSPQVIAVVAADRAPTKEERTRIEAALKAEGFTSWGKIELDNDAVWDVDDAKHSDGREYDVELDPKTYSVTSTDPD